MPHIDMEVYAATQDNPAGAVVMLAPDYDGAMIEPYRDATGNVTVGGQIGHVLASLLLLGLFLYFWFVI